MKRSGSVLRGAIAVKQSANNVCGYADSDIADDSRRSRTLFTQSRPLQTHLSIHHRHISAYLDILCSTSYHIPVCFLLQNLFFNHYECCNERTSLWTKWKESQPAASTQYLIMNFCWFCCGLITSLLAYMLNTLRDFTGKLCCLLISLSVWQLIFSIFLLQNASPIFEEFVGLLLFYDICNYFIYESFEIIRWFKIIVWDLFCE